MAPSPKPPTDLERERVAELHARGFSRNAICADLARSCEFVSKLAADAGLTFDRSLTEAATRARKADLAARRADLAALLQEDAERLRAQMWTPTKVFNFGGKDNTFEEREVPQPPHADQLKLVQAVKLAADQSMRLDEFDSGRGADAARSLLGALAKGLGLAADVLDVEDQGEGATP